MLKALMKIGIFTVVIGIIFVIGIIIAIVEAVY